MYLHFVANSVAFIATVGPTDITRTVGADDVVILCPSYEKIAPIWSINEYTYTIITLPKDFKPAFANLVIPYVFEYMNKFTFQCFIPTGVGLEVMNSSIGVLTVVNPGSFIQFTKPASIIDSEVAINHWHLRFNSDNFSLSWHYAYSHDDGDFCSFDNVTFQIEGWQCLDDRNPGDKVWQENVTNVTNINIKSKDMIHNNKSVFFIVRAISNVERNTTCTHLSFRFQVAGDGKFVINIYGEFFNYLCYYL